ncbi:phosphate ABC transporter substrate-binding protein [Endomicrobiia bacterium]|nr:phosphate ABC transporter substrate-binding protein [Endomicrobiia bacterium]GHT51171.1 phosphate ABC transporter substrate-binding protein [Endomicrobiia bacterium]GHT56032.1 phosphate ABC transporter substrate-binding protein [Endomicrobiia bacterium]
MKKILIVLLFIFCGALAVVFHTCSSTQSAGESIQVKGSETIVNLIQVWAEDFAEKYPTCNISVTGGGSGAGFASLINGTCAIAISSRQIEEKERLLAKSKNIDLVGSKVGLDGLAVLVNKNNPVNELTMGQLRDIFTAKITNWKEIGGEDGKIVILSRESNSGTHIFFKEHVLGNNDEISKNEFSEHSLMLSSSRAIYDEICQNPNALGYVSMGFVSNKVKAISIAKSEKNEYIYPTPENVRNKKYPISRPLYLYTNGSPQGIVKTFIDYALSDAGQKVVSETDFVSIIR